MAPVWLTAVAWVYLSVCLGCAGIISYDIAVRRRRQPMGVMNFVYPITALYFGPFALAFYRRWGRVATSTTSTSMSMSPIPLSMTDASEDDDRQMGSHHEKAAAGRGSTDQRPLSRARPSPWWVMMGREVSHCGSGCVVGDVISEFAIFGLGLTIAGVTLSAEYVGDYVLALAFGIVFQYFAIAPMRGLGLRDGLIAAAKADFIALSAFEIGLFGWMAIMTFVLFPAPRHLMPSSIAYWLLMQLGMIIGYGTSWPANVWLVKRGIKVPM